MEFELKLSQDEVNYILSLLAERPYKESVEVIKKITEQATSQQEVQE